MVKIRPTSEQDRQEVKAVVRRSLTMAGGVSAFEKVTRVNASALSRYGAPDEVDYHIPLDVVLDLCIDTGSNAIIAVVAARLGYKMVSLGNQCFGSSLPDIGDVSRMSGAVSDVMQEYAQAIADGAITPREKQQINIEIEEAVHLLREFQRRINSSAASGGDHITQTNR